MKKLFTIIFILFTLSVLNAHSSINFNNGWTFKLCSSDRASELDFDNSDWDSVRIPHDWAIRGPFDPAGQPETGKLPWRNEGWYRKSFNADNSLKGKVVYLLFDGIMSHPKIYINGRLTGQWDYGYNSFYLDITDYINYGSENIIAVHADTRNIHSRWYPGAGIYRKVQMIVANPVHVGIWGTYVQTPVISDEEATVKLESKVNNNSDGENEVVIRSYIMNRNKSLVAEEISTVSLQAMGKNSIEQEFTITNPERWDIDNPYMYTIISIVDLDGEPQDTVYTKFGIRDFEFTASSGFFLNGRKVMMKGVNLHHDLGPLGAAFNKSAMRRNLEIMKDMGINAVRNSHNVAAPELLDLCDEMGLMVLDEAFDKWDSTAGMSPETDFYEYMERNMTNFLLRDRNHPSVILWSIGNEIRDIQSNAPGSEDKIKVMVGYVRKYDSRPVTMVKDNMNSVQYKQYNYLDVHAWNYGRRYMPAREAAPHMPVIISESASTISTRGFYDINLPEEKTDYFNSSLQLSSYDMNSPDWAEPADYDFYWQEIDTFVVGEFVWTGFDYLGEPTPYNSWSVGKDGLKIEQTARSSFFGIVDLCGIPKDRYYLYKSLWNPEETTVHILPHWNWQGLEGKSIPVFVYTSGDEAELFINGKSLGRRKKIRDSENVFERYRLMWMDVNYEPGELKAVAYSEGKVIGESSIQTSSEPYMLKLTPEKKSIEAGGDELCYILVEAVDRNGNLCPLADNNVNFSVEGSGEIAAVGNGNPHSLEPFHASYRKLFFGKAMLILRGGKIQGECVITATSDGLLKSNTEIIIE